jgi:Ca-activated chloride channel family protein
LQGRQKDNEKYVIVITDGADTCGGDPAVAASAIRALGINVTIHVVGFGVTEQESTQLEEIAKQGGGEFRSASNLKGLVEVLKKVIPPVEKKPSLVVVKKPAPQLEAAPLGCSSAR